MENIIIKKKLIQYTKNRDCPQAILKKCNNDITGKFFNLNSLNGNNLVFLNNKIKVYRNYRDNGSLNCPVTENFELEFLDTECSDCYNEFPLLQLYLHNINNLFIPRNIDYIKIPSNIINVINLEERDDRMKKIQTYKFKKFEIKRYNAFKARPGIGWEGCARSHVDLVIKAKQLQLPYIIVAEDDFINTIDLNCWENRLISILNWLTTYDDWEIFNGLPTGLLVDKANKIINRELGLVEMVGGFNTHFIIYNYKCYDKIIKWYDYYDPTGLRFKGEMPNVLDNDPIHNHLMAIDVYLSNNTTMITTIPLLTCGNIDDSDIVGSHEMCRLQEIRKTSIRDFNKWLSTRDSRLNVNNYKEKEFLNIINTVKNDHSYKFYDNLELYKTPDMQDVIKLNKEQSKAHFNKNSQILNHFFDSYNFLLDTEKLFGNRLYNESSDVTIVCTSCNRWSYLYNTISSLIKFNSYGVKNIIITEDSGNIRMKENILKHFPFVELIFDGERKGQLTRIKEAWSKVDTKYVFHIEDDWEFLHPFFIEQSKKILENNPEILNVWLRDINDTNLHPIGKTLYSADGIHYWKLNLNYGKDWHGFTWNPTLMKYKIVQPEILSVISQNNDIMPEIILSNKFKNLGFRSAIIPGGYIRHIGQFSSLREDIKCFF